MLRGYEAMHMLRKGQLHEAAKGDVLGQNRAIDRRFRLVAGRRASRAVLALG
jgi:hypothetical protein